MILTFETFWKRFFFYLLASPWWANYQVSEDLKEKKNRLSNMYWLWLNGFTHKRRTVIKAQPHESNNFKLWFAEFPPPPSPPFLFGCWFFHHVYCLLRFFATFIRHLASVLRDLPSLFSCCWAKRNKFITLWCGCLEIINLRNATLLEIFS